MHSQRTTINKKDIFYRYLQCWNTGLLCKIEDLSQMDDEYDFRLVYSEVKTNTTCPNGHGKSCSEACGHAEANLLKALDDDTMRMILQTYGQKVAPLMTIMINNSPCRKCSDKLCEFYKYYFHQFEMKIMFANVYKEGKKTISEETKRGLIKLHKAGIKLEALSIDLEKPYFGAIDDAIMRYTDLTEEKKKVFLEKLDERRMKDLRTYQELQEILDSVDDVDTDSD